LSSRFVNLSVTSAVVATLDSSTPLIDGTDYWAAVVAVDVAGNIDPAVMNAGPARSEDNTPFVSPPLWIPMVEGLEIKDESTEDEVRFRLSWNESMMDADMFGSYGVYSAEIEFSNIIDADIKPLSPSISTTKTTLSEGYDFGQEYWFAVAIADDDGNLNYQVVSVSATATKAEEGGLAGVIQAAQANLSLIAMALGVLLVMAIATIFVMGGRKGGKDRLQKPPKGDDFDDLEPLDDLFSDTPIGGGSIVELYDV